jgi:hypothetical protein
MLWEKDCGKLANAMEEGSIALIVQEELFSFGKKRDMYFAQGG